MLIVQLLVVFGIATNLSLARPNDTTPPNVPAVEPISDTKYERGHKILTNGVAQDSVFNFAPLRKIHRLGDSDVEEEKESVTLTAIDVTSGTNGENLERKKRFFNIIGSAFQSLQSSNWRECGRTSYGTTIYTNGVGTACFGTCPEVVRCGYGNERGFIDGFGLDSFGYRGGYQTNTIHFGYVNMVYSV